MLEVQSVLGVLVDAWVTVGIIVAVVILYEFLPSLGKSLRHRLKYGRFGKPYPAALADDYRDQSWSIPLFREYMWDAKATWAPFVHWCQEPFDGVYHVFDAKGRRRTWRATHRNDDAGGTGTPALIFMFGGSTTFGMGAREDWTLPSRLARALVEDGFDVEVKNYGQIGYNSTQEVIMLHEELKLGETPDVAIFLDGVNDIHVAEQTGAVGSVMHACHRESEFNLTQRWRRGDVLRSALWSWFPRTSKLLAIADWPQSPYPALDGPVLQRLAGEVVENYKRNVELLVYLSNRYGFEAVSFWQPSIYRKKTLSDFESRYYDEGAGPLVSEVYARWKEDEEIRSSPHMVDISDIFDDEPDGIYYDAYHVTERGNEILGRAMRSHVVAALRRKGIEPRASAAPSDAAQSQNIG